MATLLGQLLGLLVGCVIAKAIAETAGSKTIAGLIRVMGILIAANIIIHSPTVKSIGQGIENAGKTFDKIGNTLEKATNNKPVEYDPTQPTSPWNPLPDDQILWGPKAKK